MFRFQSSLVFKDLFSCFPKFKKIKFVTFDAIKVARSCLRVTGLGRAVQCGKQRAK